MSKENWDSYFKAFRKQDFETAKSVLLKIVRKEKNNPQAYLKLGDIYQRTGDTFNAIASYHNSASLLKSQGFLQKALALYKIILRLDPNSSKIINSTNQLIKELESSKHPQPPPPGPDISRETDSESPELPQGSPSAPPVEPVISKSTELLKPPAPESDQEPLSDMEWLEVTLKKSEELPKDMEDLASSLSERDKFSSIPKLFSRMHEDDAKRFLNNLQTRSFHENEKVIEEGDCGDSMYIIKSGKARVVAHILGKEIELAELGKGDIFGEVSFLTGRARTADVISQGSLVVSEIGRLELENLIESDPELLSILEDFYETRVHDTIKKIKK